MRGKRAKKREIKLDRKYSNPIIARFISKVMLDGKKSLSEALVYSAIESGAEAVKEKDVVAFVEGILDELNRVKKDLPRYKERLEPHEKKIIEYLRDNGSISSSEYYDISKRAKSTRIKDFRMLRDRGIIKPVGQGKATYYVLDNDYWFLE